MIPSETVLDNPIWHALGSAQRAFSQGGNEARVFAPDVSLLAGVAELTQRSFACLADLAADRQIGLFFESAPGSTYEWVLVRWTPLLQMVLAVAPDRRCRGVVLGDADGSAMLTLADLAKPGPFAARTRQLGT